MTCPCKSKKDKENKCYYAHPTNTRWAISESCRVTRCYNPKIITDPPEWKAHIRLATVNDKIGSDVIENAPYVNVRSCFCYCDSCPHYTTDSADR